MSEYGFLALVFEKDYVHRLHGKIIMLGVHKIFLHRHLHNLQLLRTSAKLRGNNQHTVTVVAILVLGKSVRNVPIKKHARKLFFHLKIFCVGP